MKSKYIYKKKKREKSFGATLIDNESLKVGEKFVRTEMCSRHFDIFPGKNWKISYTRIFYISRCAVRLTSVFPYIYIYIPRVYKQFLFFPPPFLLLLVN